MCGDAKRECGFYERLFPVHIWGKEKPAIKTMCSKNAKGSSRMSIESDFEDWWAGVWLKVGKLAAKREYIKARKTTTALALLLGRDAYQCNKPAWQEWVHPRTWLFQGRWMDELPGVRQTQVLDWFQECKVLHAGDCGLNRWRHEDRKAIDAMKAGRI